MSSKLEAFIEVAGTDEPEVLRHMMHELVETASIAEANEQRALEMLRVGHQNHKKIWRAGSDPYTDVSECDACKFLASLDPE